MNMVITKFGRSPLPLQYDDGELANLIEQYISDTKGTFRYSYLCNHIVNQAMQDGKFKADPYTRYTEIVLTEQDCHRVNMILWQLIWDRRLIIEFGGGYNRNNNSNDTLFSTIDERWKKGGQR